MHPVLFRVPVIGYEVPGYGLALMIGFLLSIVWATRRAMKSGADPDVVLNCGFLALIGGVVGARVMYVWHYWEQYAHRGDFLAVVRAVIDVRQGGLEVYGGVIAVVVLVLGYLWWSKHSVRWYLDIMAPSAALGMALGRVGCFLNGCCWGGTCDLPWAVQFPYGSPAEVRQWSEGQPGAGLPEQLLFVAPGGMFIDGTGAIPIPREFLAMSVAELDALRKLGEQHAPKLKQLETELAAATDPKQRAALEAEIQGLERQVNTALQHSGGCACRAPPLAALTQMKKYDLDAAELKALARQYPSLPVHPTQLYSSIALGLLAALLSAVYWRRTRDGQVICVFLFIEPPTRWLIEILRADNPVDTAGFTISQFLALLLSLAGLLGLFALRRLPPRSPRARLWEPPDEDAPDDKKPAKGTASA